MMSLPVWNSDTIGNIIKHKDETNRKEDNPMADIPVWKRELLKRKQAQASRTFPITQETSKDNNFGNFRHSRYDSSYINNDINTLPIIGSLSMATPSSSSASSISEDYLEPKENSSKGGLTLINLEENPWIKAERQLGIKNTQAFRQRQEELRKAKITDKQRLSGGSVTLNHNVNKDHVDRDRGKDSSKYIDTLSDNKMRHFTQEEPDYEIYGPGIVNKLKYKYISLTQAAESSDSYMKLKRSSSLENLLEYKRGNVENRYQTNSLQRRISIKGMSQKKCFSMENLLDGLVSDSKKPRGDPLSALTNENVIIIETLDKRSVSSESSRDDVFLLSPINMEGRPTSPFKFSGSKEMLLEELPKPNTVQVCKNIFESTMEKEKQKAKQTLKRSSDQKISDKLKPRAKKDLAPRPPTPPAPRFLNPPKDIDSKALLVKSAQSDSVAFEPQVAAAQAAFDVRLKPVTANKKKENRRTALQSSGEERRATLASSGEGTVKTISRESLHNIRVQGTSVAFNSTSSESSSLNSDKNIKKPSPHLVEETKPIPISSGTPTVALNNSIIPKTEIEISDKIQVSQPKSIENESLINEDQTESLLKKVELKNDTQFPELIEEKNNRVSLAVDKQIIETKTVHSISEDETQKNIKEQPTTSLHVKRRAPPPPGTTVILEMRNGTVQTNSSVPGLTDTTINNKHNIQLSRKWDDDNPVTNIDDLVPNIDGGNLYSGLIILDDYENGDYNVFRIPDPCGIVFEGENIILEKSNLLKNKNKNLRIQFDDDAISMYEYPSEGTLTDEYEEFYGPDEQTVPTSSEELLPSSKLKNNVLSSSGGNLSNYTPNSLVSGGFELGVERPWEPPQVTIKAVEESSTDAILPGEDDMNTWSNSNSMDLLF